jgi:hypothetical protein
MPLKKALDARLKGIRIDRFYSPAGPFGMRELRGAQDHFNRSPGLLYFHSHWRQNHDEND